MLFIKPKECYLLSIESGLILQSSTMDLRQGTYNIISLNKITAITIISVFKNARDKKKKNDRKASDKTATRNLKSEFNLRVLESSGLT